MVLFIVTTTLMLLFIVTMWLHIEQSFLLPDH